jgi:protein O-mannosyl-transferase
MESENITTPVTPEEKHSFYLFPFKSQLTPILILILIGVAIYCNSLKNEYALDDGIVIHQNEYVIEGLSGIDDILTKDMYESFYRKMNAEDQLQGGRYRPLSTISFAIEQEIIGKYEGGNYKNRCWDLNANEKNDAEEDLNKDGVFNEIDCQIKGAWLRHFNNILTYILACIILYLVFSRYFFRARQDLAFLAALIFLAHPAHTEIVANIRGRQDIFSLIFLGLTFLFSFRFMETKRTIALIMAGFMFFLALMSKEYAVMVLILLPLAFHVFGNTEVNFKKLLLPGITFLAAGIFLTLMHMKNPELTDSVLVVEAGVFLFSAILLLLFRRQNSELPVSRLMMLLGVFFLAYLALRLNAVRIAPGAPDTEILNNPFLLATGEEKFCTKVYVLLKHLSLAFFPYPLSSDYSYDTIAFRHFGDWDFILSLLINGFLIFLGIRLTMKRHVLGFAILLHFLFVLMVSNFFFDAGTIFLVRWMSHSSIGFAIALAWLLLEASDKLRSKPINFQRTVLFSIAGVLIVLYGCKTIERNKVWKNDITLFMSDVKYSPNSVLVLGNAGARWIDLCDTKYISGTPNEEAYLPFDTYEESMLNIIVDENEFKDGCNTINPVKEVEEENFSNPQKLNGHDRALYKGIGYLKQAVKLHPRYVNGYLNLGLAYYKLNRKKEMFYFWKHAERLYPNNPYLKNYYIVVYNQCLQQGHQFAKEGKPDEAIIVLNNCVILDKWNPEGWYNLGGAYYNIRNYKRAEACWKEVLKLNPKHEQAIQGLKNMSELDKGSFIFENKKDDKKNNTEGC